MTKKKSKQTSKRWATSKKRRAPSDLPKVVCILDLETTDTNFSAPEKSTLLFAGTKEFKLGGNRYYPGPHRVWMPHQISELEVYLREFSGPIVGHNIFKFDHGVLSGLLSLKGIVEKTVDTLSGLWWARLRNPWTSQPDVRRFLSWKVGPELGGFSLGNLGHLNCGLKKLFDPKKLQQIWVTHPKKVIKYNERDLDLTHRIWLQIVRGKKVAWKPEAKLELVGEDRAWLLGKHPWITFDTWQLWRKIEWRRGEGHDHIPVQVCPQCGSWDQIDKFDEMQSDSDWTEGQEADWLAGHWGTAQCHACGCVIDWDGDGLEIRANPHTVVKSSKRRVRTSSRSS